MFEGIKQKGNNIAVRQSIGALFCAFISWIWIFLNFAGYDPDKNVQRILIVSVVCTVVAVTAIVHLVRAVKANPLNDIEKFCKATSNPEAMMTRLNKTWNEGIRFNNLRFTILRMDSEYIICVVGRKANIIPLSDVFWAYKLTTITNGVTYGILRIILNNGERKSFKLEHRQADIDAVLTHISKNYPNVLMGYTDKMELVYRKDGVSGLKEYTLAMRSGIDLG